MLVTILDYNGDNVIGSFNAISVVEHRKLDEYRTATLTLMPDDYVASKGQIKLNAMISFSMDVTSSRKRLYRVSSISATEKLVTVEVDDYRNVYRLANVSRDNAGIYRKWKIRELLYELNQAIENPVTDNNFYIEDLQGVPTALSTLHALGYSLSSSYNDIEVDGFDFVAMSLYDVIYTIQKAYSVYIVWGIRTVTFCDDPLNTIANDALHPYHTSVNAIDFSMKFDTSSFRAAVRPFYRVEANDRTQKITQKSVLGVKTNTWYRSQFPELTPAERTAECKKLLEIKEFSTVIEWDRRIKLHINLYDKWHQTDSEFNRRRFKCLVKYKYDDFQEGVGEVQVCNVLGKGIGTATIPTSGSVNIYNYEGTAIGYAQVSRETTEEEDNWVVHYYIHCNYFGIWSEAYGDIDLYVEGNKGDVEIYDCVRNSIGTCSLLGTEENNWTINFITNDDEEAFLIPGTDGHVTSIYNQKYSEYQVASRADITQQADVYVNDYMPEDIKSIQATPIIEDNTGIGPGMNLHIISDTYQIGDDLMITSCDIDMITHRSSNVTIGWKRKMLRDLKK